MAVSIIGEQWTTDGIDLSLEAHRDEHVKNTRALLNLAAGRKQGAPLPPYVHQEWPKHVYHPDGRDHQVADAAALEKAKAVGFRQEPYPVVRAAVGDPGKEKAELQKRLDEQRAVGTTQNELLINLRSEFDELKELAAAQNELLAAMRAELAKLKGTAPATDGKK